MDGNIFCVSVDGIHEGGFTNLHDAIEALVETMDLDSTGFVCIQKRSSWMEDDEKEKADLERLELMKTACIIDQYVNADDASLDSPNLFDFASCIEVRSILLYGVINQTAKCPIIKIGQSLEVVKYHEDLQLPVGSRLVCTEDNLIDLNIRYRNLTVV